MFFGCRFSQLQYYQILKLPNIWLSNHKNKRVNFFWDTVYVCLSVFCHLLKKFFTFGLMLFVSICFVFFVSFRLRLLISEFLHVCNECCAVKQWANWRWLHPHQYRCRCASVCWCRRTGRGHAAAEGNCRWKDWAWDNDSEGSVVWPGYQVMYQTESH